MCCVLCAVCCVLPQAEATRRSGIAYLAVNVGKHGKKEKKETKTRLEEAQLST